MPDLDRLPQRRLRATVEFEYDEIVQFQTLGHLSELSQHRLQNLEAAVIRAMREAQLPDAISQ